MSYRSVAAFLGFLTVVVPQGTAKAAPRVDFERDVQPIFQTHCVECHGEKKQKNGFRLDRRHDAMAGGTGIMIGRANADASRLYLRLIGESSGKQMPPDGPLPPEQIATLKAWIDQGADWPDALAGDAPTSPPDPTATRLCETLRQADGNAFRTLLRAHPQAAGLKGPGGSTPLMYAALYGDAEAVRLLQEAGANPNATNDAGATALMWAANDPDKTRLLLRGKADPNARSRDGRNPLLAAATWAGNYQVVKLLLDNGADPSPVAISYRGPLTPLRLAAEKGDDAVVRLLLSRGADPKAFGGVPALLSALGSGDPQTPAILIKFADREAVKSAAVMLAPPFGAPPALRGPQAIKSLVAAGADPAARGIAGRTALMLAVGSDDASEETIKTLIELGVDVNTVAPDGRTAIDFARQLGHTPVVDLLLKAGAKSGRAVVMPVLKPSPAASPRAAVERSLPLLQRADANFLRATGCVSCHNNSMTAMTVVAARSAGIRVNEETARDSLKLTLETSEVWRERGLQGMGIPGDSNTINWFLIGLAAEGHPSDLTTDAMAYFLKNDQMPDGHWRLIAMRPPLEASEIEVTALSIRALQIYAPKAHRAEYEKAIWRAADWIRAAKPRSNADRASQLLGLAWAGDNKESLQKLAQALVATQRPDGGWAQLSSMESDAFATGQAMTALVESGTIDIANPAYRRGVAYLLSTQFEDGSWHVRTRSVAFQPYFESGFPHGHDQWISAAATNLATQALIHATK